MIKEIAIDLMWFALMLGSLSLCVFLVCVMALWVKKFVDVWNRKSK